MKTPELFWVRVWWIFIWERFLVEVMKGGDLMVEFLVVLGSGFVGGWDEFVSF